MCILLADFLRTTLRLGGQESITLEEELALVRGYLAIEKVRFGRPRAHGRRNAKETLGLDSSLAVAAAGGKCHPPRNRQSAGRRSDSPAHAAQRRLGFDSVENSFDPDSPSSLKTGLRAGKHTAASEYPLWAGSQNLSSVQNNIFLVDLRLPAQRNGEGS